MSWVDVGFNALNTLYVGPNSPQSEVCAWGTLNSLVAPAYLQDTTTRPYYACFDSILQWCPPGLANMFDDAFHVIASATLLSRQAPSSSTLKGMGSPEIRTKGCFLRVPIISSSVCWGPYGGRYLRNLASSITEHCLSSRHIPDTDIAPLVPGYWKDPFWPFSKNPP